MTPRRRAWLLSSALLACAAPTDARLDAPAAAEQLRIVRPKIVTVTVTPVEGTAYPFGTVQYVATARDGQGRVLTPSSWTWTSSDTTIAVVSQTGLATGQALGNVVIKATAYPPWRR